MRDIELEINKRDQFTHNIQDQILSRLEQMERFIERLNIKREENSFMDQQFISTEINKDVA